ncbi:MAG: NUDIX hydrolase [Micrococcaceae bacterium]
MLEDTPVKKEITKSKEIHKGFVWDVVSETFTMEPDSEELSRDFVKHPGAVAVMVLNEDNEVFLVKQYRHPVKTKEWEIPAGLLDINGEDYLEAAKRELYEEADLQAKHWKVLVDYFTTPGGNNEAIRIYLAQGISEIPKVKRFQRFHEEADMEFGWFKVEEVVAALFDNRVHNPNLSLGIMTLQHVIANDLFDELREPNSPFTIHAT